MGKALILVVDDQAPNIQAVATLLSRAGYEVMPALSGAQALERCAQRIPTLVLLDMRMPEMDGFEVCGRLRENARTVDVPVIFLTAAHERETLIEAFRQGAVDYVTKPFVIEELLARVKTHVELKAARDRLAQVAQERADLTQIVAHDLKNPLAAILAASEALETADADPAAIRHTISSRVGDCLKFIDAYLGKWASGDQERQVEVESVALAPIVQDAAEALQSQADKREMQLNCIVTAEPVVVANAMAVRHVLENLISNALRYAPAGTAVDIECSVGRSGMGRVSVADRGPGVPADKRQNLFKRYSRLHEEGSVAHASGLGLAISKEEITRMNGHLWYEERSGGGAQFSFVLPLADANRDS